MKQQAINLTLPTSWAELTDKQLLMVYNLFARDLSAAEVKTLCLMKWNRLKVINEHPKHHYLVQLGKVQGGLTSSQIQAATTTLDFLDGIPDSPVRIAQLGRHRAFPANFEGVPFEKFLYTDNLYSGFLHTQQDDLLLQMAQVLYNTNKGRIAQPYLVGVFYWWTALKQLFAREFKHFFQPVANSGNRNLLAGSGGNLYEQLRDATNAQIRALTGGDITKETTIKQLDTWRALTELDAKAREAEEYRKISQSK